MKKFAKTVLPNFAKEPLKRILSQFSGGNDGQIGPSQLFLRNLTRGGLTSTMSASVTSWRHTGSTRNIKVGSPVVLDIDSDATIDLRSPLYVGAPFRHFPRRSKTHLLVSDTGVLRTLSDDGVARLRHSSILNIHGEFLMGDSYINPYSLIICRDRVSIGDNCAIAWNVQIIDSDMHQIKYGGEKTDMTAPIDIRDDVWIGSNASITKGVTIGEGAVVASDSVVVDDVPSGVLVAGSPASVVRKDVEWQ